MIVLILSSNRITIITTHLFTPIEYNDDEHASLHLYNNSSSSLCFFVNSFHHIDPLVPNTGN